jgi:hypothetical protein
MGSVIFITGGISNVIWPITQNSNFWTQIQISFGDGGILKQNKGGEIKGTVKISYSFEEIFL